MHQSKTVFEGLTTANDSRRELTATWCDGLDDCGRRRGLAGRSDGTAGIASSYFSNATTLLKVIEVF
jgi:hypothetical protein